MVLHLNSCKLTGEPTLPLLQGSRRLLCPLFWSGGIEDWVGARVSSPLGSNETPRPFPWCQWKSGGEPIFHLPQLTRSSGSGDSHPPPAGGIPTQVSVEVCGEPGLVPSSGSNELVLPLYLPEWCVRGTPLCLDKIESHKIILNMFRTQLNIAHHIKNQNISEWMKKTSKKCRFCKDRDVCIPWQGF